MSKDEIVKQSILQKHGRFAANYAALQDGINERGYADRNLWDKNPAIIDQWQSQALGLIRWAGSYAEGRLRVGPGFVVKI